MIKGEFVAVRIERYGGVFIEDFYWVHSAEGLGGGPFFAWRKDVY